MLRRVSETSQHDVGQTGIRTVRQSFKVITASQIMMFLNARCSDL